MRSTIYDRDLNRPSARGTAVRDRAAATHAQSLNTATRGEEQWNPSESRQLALVAVVLVGPAEAMAPVSMMVTVPGVDEDAAA